MDFYQDNKQGISQQLPEISLYTFFIQKIKMILLFSITKKKDLEGTFSIHSICSFKQHGFIIIQIDITFAHICICPYSLLWGKKTHASL